MKGGKLDVKKTYNNILKYIEEHPQAVQIGDVSGRFCDEKTFHKYFPSGSDMHSVIYDALEKNKVNMKGEIRNRLLNLDQAAGLIALYKLLANKDEREALSNSQQKSREVEITSGQTITLKFG